MLVNWPLLMGGGALVFGVSTYIVHTISPETGLPVWLLFIALQSVAGLMIGFIIQRLQTMAYTDGLTKVWNRHYLNKLRTWLHSGKADIGGLSVIILDVDNFKQINDSEGHLAGDDVLVHIAQILRHNARQTDIIVRLGGDEFLILLPGTQLEDAKAAAERIRRDIRSCPRSYNVTVSTGITSFVGPTGIREVIAEADQALYRAKDSKAATIPQ
ncbi:GGDEF domain-containing protein [Anaeroselena agilis]|uniref:GGDEF domain-containing protein n=1 Tax=Anaeroselena agilis TaxID=3063788 RepID=A0ABU3NS49_9FIRM|nr:GGDEF domain-containing protein [Selenomonadales bacterium 4137-cl]